MKINGILKFLLVVVLIGVVGLVGMYSWGSKTFKYSTETRINAMPQDVYTHLTQPSLLEQWMGGVEDIQPINDKGEPLVDEEGKEVNVATDIVGARAKAIVNSGGQEFVLISEVTNSSYGHSLETRVESDAMVAVVRYSLSKIRNDDKPLEPDTKLVEEMEVQYKGIARFMGPFAGSAIETKLKEDMETLKQLVESGEALAAFKEEPQRFDANREQVKVMDSNVSFRDEIPPPEPGTETDDDSSDDDSSDDDSSDDDSSDDDSSDDDSSDDDSSDDDSSDDDSTDSDDDNS